MPQRKRICFLIRSLGVGGSERQLFELVKGLNREQFQVTVLTYYAGGRFWDALARTPGVDLRHLSKKGRWDILPFVFRFLKEVWFLEPDVLHTYLSTSNLFGVLAKICFPGVTLIWGVRGHLDNIKSFSKIDHILWKLERILSRIPNATVTNSNRARDFLIQQGFLPTKVCWIPNGLNVEEYQFSRSDRDRWRSQHKLSPNECAVGIVARIDPMKDHTTFLKAAKLLEQGKLPFRFFCIGTGNPSLLREYQNYAASLGLKNLIWTGEASNMQAVYSSLDIVCSTSISEGFPNTLLEAMACERYCVSTKAGDSPLILGDTGIVIPQADPQALVSALLSLFNSRNTHHFSNPQARRRVEQYFNHTALVERTSRLLESILVSGTCRHVPFDFRALTHSP